MYTVVAIVTSHALSFLLLPSHIAAAEWLKLINDFWMSLWHLDFVDNVYILYLKFTLKVWLVLASCSLLYCSLWPFLIIHDSAVLFWAHNILGQLLSMRCLSYIICMNQQLPAVRLNHCNLLCKQYKVYSNVYPYNCIVAAEQLSVSVQNHKQNPQLCIKWIPGNFDYPDFL